ncbi:MAG: sulfatase-like hydrolase/transferase [Vicinamibacterales bacterium]
MKPAGRRAGLPAVALAILAAVAGCRGSAPASAPATHARHLVLVTIDTLRADRLGAYGNTTVPTPNFDRLAREGARALDATTHVPITRPAHTSLFTARYPWQHGVRDNIAVPLAAGVPTLAETLAARGFATAAFVSSFVLSAQSGLNRGFAHYDDRFGVDPRQVNFLGAVQRRGDDTIARLEAWLDGRSAADQAKPTALWVHLYDPHDPYEPPEPFATQFAGREYDGEVAWTDTLLGRLRSSLEARQLWNDALVVVVADHGEALGEHGETGHGFFAYETTLAVPLVLRGPGVAPGTTVTGPFRLIDVAPTVLGLLGLPPLAGATGADRTPNLAPGGPPIVEPTYAESLTPLIHYQWSDLRVWREGRWKYILAPRPELYDLAADPGERHDLAATDTATARRLRAALEGQLRAEREHVSAAPAEAALSAEALQKLGALGYVSPGAAPGTTAIGADPKDKIAEFQTLSTLMREGLMSLEARRFAESAARFARLRQAGADSFQVHFYEGRALAGLGQWREAEQRFDAAIARMPSFAEAHLALAEARLARRDARGALEAIQRGEASAPRDPALVDREGQIWQELGDPARAKAAYERVVAMAPKDALVRWRLGELHIALRQPAEALVRFREATELDPTVGDFWNSLGMVLGGDGRNDEAAAAFRQAATRDPKNARFAYNLGLVLMRGGRPEAAEWFQRTLAIDPAFRPAKDRLAELGR